MVRVKKRFISCIFSQIFIDHVRGTRIIDWHLSIIRRFSRVIVSCCMGILGLVALFLSFSLAEIMFVLIAFVSAVLPRHLLLLQHFFKCSPEQCYESTLFNYRVVYVYNFNTDSHQSTSNWTEKKQKLERINWKSTYQFAVIIAVVHLISWRYWTS